MSLLTRKGTIIRGNRGSGKRRSLRRQTSSGSNRTGSTSSRSSRARETPSVSGIKKEENAYSHASPARSVASTVVSFDDEKQLCNTSIDWRGTRTVTEQPPNYGTLILQIQEANKEAEDTCDFLYRSTKILCNTLFVTVLVGVLTALPIAMMSVGVKYLSDCPKEPNVPVYLLVGGCFGMLKLLSTLWHNIQIRRNEDADVFYDAHESEGAFASRTYKMMDIILSMFLFAWLIVGTYWVFKIWEPHYKQLLHEPSEWCDRSVYMFAVYQIIGCYSYLCIVLIYLLCLAIFHKCSNSYDS